MKPWEKFKVGLPSEKPNWVEPNCCGFSIVSHTCHIEQAIRIISDKCIKAGLVFDESKFNKTRTLVVWLSPNDWGAGYRYGNISFKFNFEEIIQDKRYYWVESIDKYSPQACRILISDQVHEGLTIYDPCEGNGPWWYDSSSQQHYYNGEICLEFMFEMDLSLNKVSEIHFVSHHESYCSIYPNQPDSCKELGFSFDKGGALFLCKAASLAMNLSNDNFLSGRNELSRGIKNALDGVGDILFELIKGCTFTGLISERDLSRIALSRAILNSISLNELDESVQLINLFDEKQTLFESISEILASTIGLENTDLITKRIECD